MRVSRIKKWLAVLIVGLVLTLFIITTDPSKLPLPLLVVPFLLLFTFLFILIKQLLPTRIVPQAGKRRTIVAGFGATLPVLLLLFQSIHQLTIRDVFVALSLGLVAAFYLSKADFIQ